MNYYVPCDVLLDDNGFVVDEFYKKESDEHIVSKHYATWCAANGEATVEEFIKAWCREWRAIPEPEFELLRNKSKNSKDAQ